MIDYLLLQKRSYDLEKESGSDRGRINVTEMAKKDLNSPSGSRTRVSALKGPYPNRWTNEELETCDFNIYNHIESMVY